MIEFIRSSVHSRINRNIKCLTLISEEHKLSQDAEHTTKCVGPSETSIRRAPLSYICTYSVPQGLAQHYPRLFCITYLLVITQMFDVMNNF